LLILQSSRSLTGKELLWEPGEPSKRKANAQLLLPSSHSCPEERAGFADAVSRLPLCACHGTNTAQDPGPAAGQRISTPGEQTFLGCMMLLLTSSWPTQQPTRVQTGA